MERWRRRGCLNFVIGCEGRAEFGAIGFGEVEPGFETTAQEACAGVGEGVGEHDRDCLYRGADAVFASKEHVAGDVEHEEGEHDAEEALGDEVSVGEPATEVTADGEARGEEHGGLEVDVAVAPVGQEGEDADGGEEQGEAGADGELLRKGEEEDERGDDEDAATDAEHATDDTDDESDEDEGEPGWHDGSFLWMKLEESIANQGSFDFPPLRLYLFDAGATFLTHTGTTPMPSFKDVTVPANRQAITIKGGKLNVPDHPILPFIEGDGTGPDIWRASVRVFDAAVEKGYKGRAKIGRG